MINMIDLSQKPSFVINLDAKEKNTLLSLIESHYDMIDHLLFDRNISNGQIHELRELNHEAREIMKKIGVSKEARSNV